MMSLRWRVRTLVGLVIIAALGFKGVLLLQPPEPLSVRRQALVRLTERPRPASAEATLLAALGDPELRQTAMWALVQIGSTSPALVAALVGQLEVKTAESRDGDRWDYHHQVYPAQTLKNMKLPAATIAPMLRKAMASPDTFIRSGATLVLCDAAGRPGPPAPILTELLLVALQDRDNLIRVQVPEALARLDGKTRRRAVAILLNQLRQPGRPSQLLATNGLAYFDPEAAEAFTILADRLKGNDLPERIADLFMLGQLGPLARPAVPAIVQAMTSRDAMADVVLLWPLKCFDPAADILRGRNRFKIIESGAGHWHPSNLYFSNLCFYGAATLELIGPEAERQALEILKGMVRGEDRPQRLAAIDAIGVMGLFGRKATASALIPILLEIAEREKSERERADQTWDKDQGHHRLMSALQFVCDGDDPRFGAALIRMMDSPDPQKRYEAALNLTFIDPPVLLAVPGLIRRLKDKSQPIRYHSAEALGRYTGPEREAAIPALLEALDDGDEGVRIQVAKALAHFHTGADRAVPILVLLLRSQGDNHRYQAAEILGEFGPDAKLAIPALQEAQRNSSKLVRDQAETALKAINPTSVGNPVK
jgi:HEAT repeat protein